VVVLYLPTRTPQDTVENYAPVLSKHIKRFENAQAVMTELTAQLTEFHTKVGGDVGKVSALFSDLTPEPQVRNPQKRWG
jgi:hypothetical protein